MSSTLLKLFSVVALTHLSAGLLFTENPEQQKYIWEEFKNSYSKVYASVEEENMRFGYFLDILRLADERNRLERETGGTAEHGITRFADMSQSEFEKTFLSTGFTLQDFEGMKRAPESAPYNGTNALVDWTGKYTSPVKDQKSCGSCWAFSAAEQIESDFMREKGKNYILSPQQLVDCETTHSSNGCDGGWYSDAFWYAYVYGGMQGIMQESDYPYTAVQGTCKANSAKYVAKLADYWFLSFDPYASNPDANMANYVKSTGPVSIAVDATTWNTYTGGIMSTCGKSLNHAVQATGVDDTANTGYWKVRNTWTTSWGESGFIRLKYGANTCGVAWVPMFTDPL